MKKPPQRPRPLLLRVREFLGLTQRQMARMMGVDASTVSQWETGATRFPPHRLDTLLVIVLDAPHDDAKTPTLLAAIRKERSS